MEPTHGYLTLRCDLAVFNTQWVSDEFPEYTGDRMVLYPPVDPDWYRVPLNKSGKVLQVNLCERKGADWFYKAAELLPGTEFLGVAGGYYAQDLRDMGNVELRPNTPDIRTVYRDTRLVVMPSEYESFGRVAVEAAASGIPSVVRPTPGLMEALGTAGVYVDSPEEMADAIKRLGNARNYAAASRRSLARSKELKAKTDVQLEEFLRRANMIARMGISIRGW
jgi:glycosyltransferase involved in cell wall biosynthesis